MAVHLLLVHRNWRMIVVLSVALIGMQCNRPILRVIQIVPMSCPPVVRISCFCWCFEHLYVNCFSCRRFTTIGSSADVCVSSLVFVGVVCEKSPIVLSV